MSEGIFKSFDPLSYFVNNISDLDKKLVTAHRNKDNEKINEIISYGDPLSADVFICVNKGYHAFLLVFDFCKNQPAIGPKAVSDDPFDVHDLTFVWKIELRFENVQLRTYQIAYNLVLFKDIKPSIKKSYHIGRYEKIKSRKCIDLAILQAAPHHYNAILNDCVEFAKEFCLCLLSFCSNGNLLEKEVQAQIKKATATGLSIEHLSRNSAASGILGNISLAGIDVSSLIGGFRNTWVILVIISFVLFYPIAVAMAVYYFMARSY